MAQPAAAALPVAQQPAVQPVVPVVQPAELPANNPGVAAPLASGSFPVGFQGLSYNANGQNALSIDISDAQAAGATVTTFFDRVEVYQHHSPGVLLTFWGDNFRIDNGSITGPVSRAEFVTDPLNATLGGFGNVSGSVHAALPALTRRVSIELTIPGNVSAVTLNQIQDILGSKDLRLNTVAYTFNVHKVDLTTGPANVTFTIPAAWVDQHGGKDAVRITRISETGEQELLVTVYRGLDARGNMIFRGDSPNGTSLFGLVTTEATIAEQKEHPNTTYVGVSKSAMVTSVGMYGWLIDSVLHNPVLLVGVAGLLAAIAYFGWWKRRL